MQVSSTIWAVTLSLLIADRATIPHLKGDNEGFHMRYSSMIWCKRLQSDRLILPLNIMPLVLYTKCNLAFGVHRVVFTKCNLAFGVHGEDVETGNSLIFTITS